MAYSFASASSQYLVNNAGAISSGSVTLACWATTAGGAGTQSLLSVCNATDANRIVLSHAMAAGGESQMASTDSGAQQIVTSSAGDTTADEWHHFAGVHASGSRFAYLDGGGGTEGTTSVSPTGLDRTLVGSRLSSGSLGNYQNGWIAEAGIWNVVLTSAEIAILAKGYSPLLVRPSALVFYAPLIRGLDDRVGGLTLTNTNAATVTAHPRVIYPKRRAA